MIGVGRRLIKRLGRTPPPNEAVAEATPVGAVR
jgi:hypothetical protein